MTRKPPVDLREYEALVATTRSVQLPGDEFKTSFAREALEDMVRQIEETCVWLNVEHLGFLPPSGRWRHAEIREADDGESELFFRGGELPQYLSDAELDQSPFPADLPVASTPDLSLKLTYDRRNFTPEVAAAIEAESDGLASPVERWAELPPIEYSLVIPVVWGATQFMGSFLKELGRAAGAGLAARIGAWTKRSRQPDRTVVFTLDFELPDGGHVCGFALAPPDDVEVAVDNALLAVEDLAAIAGAVAQLGMLPDVKQAAYFLDGDHWHLGWWSDGERVIRTPWFEANPPDIQGVLGRPPFGKTE